MKAAQKKFPSEIFGVHWRNKSAAGAAMRDAEACRFTGGQCDKKGHVFNPFGACSARIDGETIPLCPKRMLEDGVAFRAVAELHFGTTQNVVACPEISVKGVGNLDFVLVRHEPAGQMRSEFAVVEIQGGQTSNTGHLTRAYSDLLRKGAFEPAPPYNFTVNYYDVWKRSLIQILTKGIVMEIWGAKIYWVVPSQLFAYFQDRYRLGELKHDKNHSTVFALCDLEEKKGRFVLTEPQWRSITMEQLFDAFRNNLQIPSLDEFRKKLEKRLMSPVQMRLQIPGKDAVTVLSSRLPAKDGGSAG